MPEPPAATRPAPPLRRLARALASGAWRLPPVLLAALALCQIALVEVASLSPWKGGGFGMFASNDHGALRSVRVSLDTPQGERPVALSAELDRARRLAREFPVDRTLRALADGVFAEHPEASGLRIQIWRLRFSPDDLAAHRELVVDRRFRAAP